jgi:nucleotide-binding universal stress UspA family protein
MIVPTDATGLETFDRIVCGVDGTPESLEAARQAECLRSPGGTLEVAAVADVDVAVHAGWAMGSVLGEIEAGARESLHRAVDEVAPSSTHLLAGGVVPCLLEEVERNNATLVAVGPRGHSRAAGMLIGGVATELLHRARCSVLFARKPELGCFPSSILVGVDGSPQSLTATAVAESLARRFHAELVLVAATGGKGIDIEPIQQLSPFFITDPGHPVEALSELSHEADLLVVGSRGLHGPKALGSVSERVAHRAACSVLVVRNP